MRITQVLQVTGNRENLWHVEASIGTVVFLIETLTFLWKTGDIQ